MKAIFFVPIFVTFLYLNLFLTFFDHITKFAKETGPYHFKLLCPTLHHKITSPFHTHPLHCARNLPNSLVSSTVIFKNSCWEFTLMKHNKKNIYLLSKSIYITKMFCENMLFNRWHLESLMCHFNIAVRKCVKMEYR